jgi:hypothetical protein
LLAASNLGFITDFSVKRRKNKILMPFMNHVIIKSVGFINLFLMRILVLKNKNLGRRIMASLSIKNLDSNIYDKLSVRAARHGISMEEEVRQILYLAVATPEKNEHSFSKIFWS